MDGSDRQEQKGDDNFKGMEKTGLFASEILVIIIRDLFQKEQSGGMSTDVYSNKSPKQNI